MVFFSLQVSKLAEKANNIAQETLEYQKKINENENYWKKQFNEEKTAVIGESREKKLNLNKSLKEINEKVEYEEYKDWKQINTKLLDEFLKKK